ncbi:MAG TPA: DUF1854 domain-containing protein [Firmicutes bacterium]|nr:DUF1854 domain-containing protein [Bacillota bacterium]
MVQEPESQLLDCFANGLAHYTTAEYARDCWEPGWLDTAKLSFGTSRSWGLCLTMENVRTWLGVRIVRSFPLTMADSYIVFLNRKNEEIGTIRSLAELSPSQRALVEEEIRRRYLVNEVKRINALRAESDTLYFDVETSRGRREFVVRANRETVIGLDGERVLLIDVDGNRFAISDLRQMDASSQAVLQQVL